MAKLALLVGRGASTGGSPHGGVNRGGVWPCVQERRIHGSLLGFTVTTGTRHVDNGVYGNGAVVARQTSQRIGAGLPDGPVQSTWFFVNLVLALVDRAVPKRKSSSGIV